MDINNYMTPQEAADRWQLPVRTVRQRLDIKRHPALIDDLNQGTVKGYKSPGSKITNWIISTRAMEKWYGPEPIVANDKKI